MKEVGRGGRNDGREGREVVKGGGRGGRKEGGVRKEGRKEEKKTVDGSKESR